MRLRKISAEDRDVMRKRRTQNNNNVSFWHEEYDCESLISLVDRNGPCNSRGFGISKEERRISSKYWVHPCVALINGP